ncbi:hypothetical protein BDV37DRAFT_225248 [Aspergillus pseudonomiae]|uniref:Uncharacterized protein n=1 Tax=Aspergillus pseudonomiae TaxID=1506151 RepID=A0A5N7D0K1_9EURO|nr:uncharacterized protein BDV37DRAFT_225248 [Aspergillus pseudonomiae]KAE8399729.1 hypothetical protein BDV37DRAFT_225248 [Aspergillus pseudonomiae]
MNEVSLSRHHNSVAIPFGSARVSFHCLWLVFTSGFSSLLNAVNLLIDSCYQTRPIHSQPRQSPIFRDQTTTTHNQTMQGGKRNRSSRQIEKKRALTNHRDYRKLTP